MNRVNLIGYLAQDPKAKVTQKGLDQSNITIAVGDCENYNATYFIKCVAFGSIAKYINEKMQKGSLVAIDGKLINRKFMNNKGKNLLISEVIVSNVQVFTNKKKTIDWEQRQQEILNNYASDAKFPEEDIYYEIDEIINN